MRTCSTYTCIHVHTSTYAYYTYDAQSTSTAGTCYMSKAEDLPMDLTGSPP